MHNTEYISPKIYRSEILRILFLQNPQQNPHLVNMKFLRRGKLSQCQNLTALRTNNATRSSRDSFFSSAAVRPVSKYKGMKPKWLTTAIKKTTNYRANFSNSIRGYRYQLLQITVVGQVSFKASLAVLVNLTRLCDMFLFFGFSDVLCAWYGDAQHTSATLKGGISHEGVLDTRTLHVFVVQQRSREVERFYQ